MHRPVSLAVVAVIVAASLSILVVSETPERSFSNLGENMGKSSDASNEERARPPFEITPSVVSRVEHPEPHAAIPNMVNEHDMALIRNYVAEYFNKKIDIRMVGTSLIQLRELPITASGVDNYKLILMAIGNELLKLPFPDYFLRNFRPVADQPLMKRDMSAELYHKWKNLLAESSFSPFAMFEMMRYLIEQTRGVKLDLSEYGYMAMGRVLLSSPQSTPSNIPILPRLTRLEKLSMRRGVDPTKTKLQLQRLKEKKRNHDEGVLLSEALDRTMGDHLTLGRGKKKKVDAPLAL